VFSAKGRSAFTASLGQRPRVHEKALALKARFTGDVIRSIIGRALISASGMFGIENHH
jgi:hypothetical protein